MTFQIQTPDGKWHLTDENGNLLPEQEKKEAPATETPALIVSPKRKRSRKDSDPTSDSSAPVHFSMKIPKEDYRILSSYIHWHSIFKAECTRSELLLRSAMEVIRKDREYKEFLRRNTLDIF